MEYRRTRYLIQHRESKRYIKASTNIDDEPETTDDTWYAWEAETPEDALRNLEIVIDKNAYRIVKAHDTRQQPEDDENE